MDDQNQKQEEAVSARERAKIKVKSFIRKIEFENYIRGGMSPYDAAGRVGIKLPPASKDIRTADILRIIERGSLPKKI